ncbi:MAG: HipA N-terminal domain-containing protein [Fibrobacteria bacterium]|nr:HipA N-terminal domain-containing protein [Fibrobacteria bacterium]
MNRTAIVYFNQIFAGNLEEHSSGYTFRYDEEYLANTSLPPIAIQFPKTQKEFHAKALFPFFFGLLAEGVNKEMQCRVLKIDEKEHFTRLLQTANINVVGAITVREK